MMARTRSRHPGGSGISHGQGGAARSSRIAARAVMPGKDPLAGDAPIDTQHPRRQNQKPLHLPKVLPWRQVAIPKGRGGLGRPAPGDRYRLRRHPGRLAGRRRDPGARGCRGKNLRIMSRERGARTWRSGMKRLLMAIAVLATAAAFSAITPGTGLAGGTRDHLSFRLAHGVKSHHGHRHFAFRCRHFHRPHFAFPGHHFHRPHVAFICHHFHRPHVAFRGHHFHRPHFAFRGHHFHRPRHTWAQTRRLPRGRGLP